MSSPEPINTDKFSASYESGRLRLNVDINVKPLWERASKSPLLPIVGSLIMTTLLSLYGSQMEKPLESLNKPPQIEQSQKR